MKSLHMLAFFAVLLLVFSLNEGYCGQDYLEYRVEVNSDGSASWTIVLVSDVSASVDSWEGFQQRIFMLVEAAVDVSNRKMGIEPETIQMETAIAWETQAKTTEFRFKWLNFSVFENGKVVFGDVFGVQSFFAGLYGDGRLRITYPVGYGVMEVSPKPDRQDGGSRMMEWFRTQDFLNGKPRVALVSDSSSLFGGGWVQYVVLGLVLAAAALASLGGFYLVRRRRSKAALSRVVPVGQLLFESDEDKVMKFVRSSGGSVFQSGICEQFGFSKAKTSQLLASLESKGVVARYKRGRDKIVTLIERKGGDS